MSNPVDCGGPPVADARGRQILDLVLAGTIEPGRVFDASVPLAKVADGYRAMDERRSIKVVVRP